MKNRGFGKMVGDEVKLGIKKGVSSKNYIIPSLLGWLFMEEHKGAHSSTSQLWGV